MNIPQKFRRLVRAIVGMPDDEGQPPIFDRMAFYRAKVAACAADGSTCDLQPEDSRFPSMKNVPVRVGVPGLQAVVQPGAVVLLGWERGDPARPYCEPSWEGGAKVTSITVTDAANDSITISNGTVTIKVGGTQVFQASATALKLGLVGTLAVLVQGSVDSMGVPVTQNPAATATIVKAG